MSESREEALRVRLAALKIVPVIRTPSADLAIRACEWLLEAGLQALELTFTTPDAHRVIETFTRTAPDALIGAAVVKIFPARECGGPGFLKAVRSVYPEIPLMPTGGVSPETAKAYLDAGALCLGMGGELVPVDALKANDPGPVREAAARALAMVHG